MDIENSTQEFYCAVFKEPNGFYTWTAYKNKKYFDEHKPSTKFELIREGISLDKAEKLCRDLSLPFPILAF